MVTDRDYALNANWHPSEVYIIGNTSSVLVCLYYTDVVLYTYRKMCQSDVFNDNGI
jgi:hypothetical protein